MNFSRTLTGGFLGQFAKGQKTNNVVMESDLKIINSGGSRRGCFTELFSIFIMPAHIFESSGKGSELAHRTVIC